jgi:hypothetical protein
MYVRWSLLLERKRGEELEVHVRALIPLVGLAEPRDDCAVFKGPELYTSKHAAKDTIKVVKQGEVARVRSCTTRRVWSRATWLRGASRSRSRVRQTPRCAHCRSLVDGRRLGAAPAKNLRARWNRYRVSCHTIMTTASPRATSDRTSTTPALTDTPRCADY